MHWHAAVELLRRERRAGVLVTVTAARGHAPREPGAKLVVARAVPASRAASGSAPVQTWGTIGGGNLEETALDRAAELLDGPPGPPESLTLQLTERARTEHGRQCCGGEVTLLFEHLPVLPAVAVFGAGHVGLELARILSRQELELHVVDSRADRVDAARLAFLDDGPAGLHPHHAPLPELVLGEVPPGTHVLVMTHDHAEDFALCDTALRCEHLASIGLIGSAAKWRRFQRALTVEGHDAAAIARIQCPIGRPELVGKDPATIALGVAADLLARLAWAGPRLSR
ncbi:xanthine dehydrogenase accessory protein XdhC [Nocardioides sp.]|uniref:xanthine dehydrogenase accessory protein XdhC n=1 Tax=Nocardioides sp. TaxID=35761 RepID=UPI002621430B|nr:xanthine dehydrogenase accessory protein XdhC [Nocardioides sp.]MDI6909529.1 xanthine dehydrogenase accessory protein XdhC [Nocardioides sp.]